MTVTRRLRSRARSVRPAAAALQAGELSWGEQGGARGWGEAQLMGEFIDRPALRIREQHALGVLVAHAPGLTIPRDLEVQPEN